MYGSDRPLDCVKLLRWKHVCVHYKLVFLRGAVSWLT